MITVQATSLTGMPFHLYEMKINPNNIESMENLGDRTCQVERNIDSEFTGPICKVIMTSGQKLYINATSEELEARSA